MQKNETVPIVCDGVPTPWSCQYVTLRRQSHSTRTAKRCGSKAGTLHIPLGLSTSLWITQAARALNNQPLHHLLDGGLAGITMPSLRELAHFHDVTEI